MEKPSIDVSRAVVVLDPGDVGLGIARSLGRLGVPVLGVRPDCSTPGAASRYWRGHNLWPFSTGTAGLTEFLLQVAAGISSVGPPLLIPTDDETCLYVADEAEKLRTSFLFPDQPPGLARRLADKRSMFDLCRKHSIPTPETVFPTSRREVEAFASAAKFPVMVKGIYTWAQEHAARMKLAHDQRDLLRAYDEMEIYDEPNVMLQEYIPGGQETLWVFEAYFNQDSECLFSGTGQKLRQYPPYTGRTSLGVYRSNAALTLLATRFFGELGYRGILDSGFKFDARTGQYMLLDANPRIGTPFRLFTDRSGMDVARAMYLDLTGQTVTTGAEPEGRRWIAEDNDISSSLRYIRDGHLSPASWAASYRGVEEACWFASDDLRPAWRRVKRVTIQNFSSVMSHSFRPFRHEP